MKSRLPSATNTEFAAANAALEACAALLRAQGDEKITEPEPPARPTPPAPPAIDPQLIKEQARLDQLLSAIGEICAGGHSASAQKPGGSRASAQILEHAKKVIDGERRAIEAHIEAAKPAPTVAPAAPAKPVRKVAHDRSLRFALDKYFSYFEVPGTQWQLVWQLLTPSGLPSATAFSTTPGGIEAEFAIALPDGEPWRVAAKLSKIEIPADKTIAIVSSGGKPLAPSKYYLVGLSWAGSSGSITLSRSRKKLNAPLRIDFSEDGSVGVSPIGPTGEALAPEMDQPGPTSSYLEAAWWKLATAAVDLVHARGSAASIKFDGALVEHVVEPAKLADVILEGNRELFRKVSSEADPEVFQRLAAKFDDLPSRFHSRLVSIGFAAGSNPPTSEDASDAEETFDARLTREPTAAPVAEPPMTIEVSEDAIEDDAELPTTSFDTAEPEAAQVAQVAPIAQPRDPHNEPTRRVAPPKPPGRALTVPPPPAIDAPIDLSAEPAEDQRRISERTIFEVAPKRPDGDGDEDEDQEEEELTLAAPKHRLAPKLRTNPGNEVELGSEPQPMIMMKPIAAVGSAPAKIAVQSVRSVPESEAKAIEKEKPSKVTPPALGTVPAATPTPTPKALTKDLDETRSPALLSARELGQRLFGPNTIREKFDSLDLEIEWDGDESSDDPNETLPGVVPSVTRPAQVTIEN